MHCPGVVLTENVCLPPIQLQYKLIRYLHMFANIRKDAEKTEEIT